jgi:hypothetical protein
VGGEDRDQKAGKAKRLARECFGVGREQAAQIVDHGSLHHSILFP